ncbi:MAG: hypothetical protein Q9162_002871 [Coniocarpon cinnabarinum]
MALRTLGPQNAAKLDEELMSTGGFSVDQLMELAGFSVAQAVLRFHSPQKGTNLLIPTGPGNNGGDGLVAARHLKHFGYNPTVYYPKQPPKSLYPRLVTQLKHLSIPIYPSNPSDPSPTEPGFDKLLEETDLVIDAIFGFSFSGPLREPFPGIIRALEGTTKPVLAVDAPSSWDVEKGPPPEGEVGHQYMPGALVSLTAPKPCVKFFKGRHFVGGRFLGKEVADRYGIDVPAYQGGEQVVELGV